MQMTINVPENLPPQRILQRIQELEMSLHEEAQFFQTVMQAKQGLAASADPWGNAELAMPAVDTGIEDFAQNHDHYLYGTDKKA